MNDVRDPGVLGGVTSRQVVQGYVVKQAKQDMSRKPVSSGPPWPLL